MKQLSEYDCDIVPLIVMKQTVNRDDHLSPVIADLERR